MGIPLRYNYRNVFRRKLRTFLTVLGITLVVLVAIIMLAFSRGLLWSLRNNGDADNVLIMSRKAEDRIFSNMSKKDYGLMYGIIADEVAVYDPTEGKTEEPEEAAEEEEDEGGFGEGGFEEESNWEDEPILQIAPYVYHTTVVNVSGSKSLTADGGQGMILGVEPTVQFYMNRLYKLTAGRELEPGDARACMIGAMVYARLGLRPEDLAVGKTITFSGTDWKIVGHFSVPGSSADSEIWVPIDELMTVTGRDSYSYAVAKVNGPDNSLPPKQWEKAAIERANNLANKIGGSEQMELKAMSERDFYRGFAETFRHFAIIGVVMSIIIMAGGLTAGMNTMYTAVAGRVREIGMLQVLGFSKRSVVFSFVAESVLISLAGGVVGSLLGLLVNGIPMKVTMGVFKFRVDEVVLGAGIAMALFIGLVGALVPALRAVKLRMVDAMRFV